MTLAQCVNCASFYAVAPASNEWEGPDSLIERVVSEPIDEVKLFHQNVETDWRPTIRRAKVGADNPESSWHRRPGNWTSIYTSVYSSRVEGCVYMPPGPPFERCHDLAPCDVIHLTPHGREGWPHVSQVETHVLMLERNLDCSVVLDKILCVSSRDELRGLREIQIDASMVISNSNQIANSNIRPKSESVNGGGQTKRIVSGCLLARIGVRQLG